MFGSDPEAEALVRTAAVQLFTKQYKSVSEAKNAYDLQLRKAKERTRTIQLKGLELPVLSRLNRKEVSQVFEPIVEQIGRNFANSNLGEDDAMQIARLTVLEAFEGGERDPAKIADKMISEVTKEAAAYAAFNRLTVELPNRK